MTQEALNRIAEKLRRAGASLPAPEVTGTIEGSIVTGLCIALALVESEIEALAQPEQEPMAYDKTEMNCFVQDLYDKKMQEGKHGHYETMFHVVHQAIKKVPPQRTWVGLTKQQQLDIFAQSIAKKRSEHEHYMAIEQALKEKNT